MKKALILHAWFEKSTDNWYPWLKEQLESRGYEVWLPDLVTMDTKEPQPTPMLDQIMKQDFVDSDTIIVGHSLGSVLALRLAEKTKYKTCILLAGWDYNDLLVEHAAFWLIPINHALAKKNVSKFVCIVSDTDPYFTKYQTLEMAKRLGAEVVEVGAKGHFLSKPDGVTKVPEIIKFV